MKILQLSVHFSPNVGGVETHLNDLVSSLVAKNHEVCVLTYKPLTAKVDAKIWDSKRNLKILRIPWFAGLFYKLVRNPVLEFLYLTPMLFLTLPFVVLVFKPRVIHTHGLIAGFVGVFWGKIFRIRTLTTTHSLYHFPERGLYPKFAHWIFSNSQKILTLSKMSKNEIERLGVVSSKVKVFTYWIDLEKFKPVSGKQRDGNRKFLEWNKKFIVLFVGRLVEEKGVLVLLESLKDWNKTIHLVIAGTGPLESEIRNRASDIRNLMFLGKVDNDKLPLYYSSADVVIVPSIHDEGFGRIILESLASGTPVVAANRGAIPEAMDESVGILIDINPKNIKDTIELLYRNPTKIKIMSSKARIFAEKRYSNSNLDIITALYS